MSFGPSRSLVPFWSVLLEKDRTVRLFIEGGHFWCSLVCKVAELQEILPCEVWQFEFWPIETFCPFLVCSVREGQNWSDCVFKLLFLRVLWFVRLRDSKTYCFATSSNSIFWPIEKSCAFSLCVVLESRNCDDCVLEWETAHFIEQESLSLKSRSG